MLSLKKKKKIVTSIEKKNTQAQLFKRFNNNLKLLRKFVKTTEKVKIIF